MKRRFLPHTLFVAVYTFFIAMIGLFSACEIETSDNGELDGYWQLATIEDLQGNRHDMIPSRQFWSFQVRMLQLSDQHYILPSYLFRFEHRGDSLRIFDPYVLDRTSADYPVTDISVLTPYYIFKTDLRFYIERMDDDKMSLRTDSLHFHFNRY